MAYKIDSYYCVGCEACYRVCRPGAVEIVVEEHNCRINPEKCVECGVCVIECPVAIITLDRSEGSVPAKRWTKIWIEEAECIGCSRCQSKCPMEAIEGERKQPYHIEESKCIKCGACMDHCPKQAVHAE